MTGDCGDEGGHRQRVFFAQRHTLDVSLDVAHVVEGCDGEVHLGTGPAWRGADVEASCSICGSVRIIHLEG